MISLEDVIGFCDLTLDEIQVVAAHERVVPSGSGSCCAWPLPAPEPARVRNDPGHADR